MTGRRAANKHQSGWIIYRGGRWIEDGAGDGAAKVWGMILDATVGSAVGAWWLYLASAAIGRTRLHALVARYGRWVGVRPHDLVRAESWFDDHSSAAVLVCRCIPLIRSLVSIPAGFRRMNPVTFTVYTALGSALWNSLLIGAGYLLGENWEQVSDYVSTFQYVVIGAILLGLAWWVWTRFLSPTHRARRAAEDLAFAEAELDAEAVLEATD